MNNEEYVSRLQRVDGKPITVNERGILRFMISAGFNPEEVAECISLEDITIDVEVRFLHLN